MLPHPARQNLAAIEIGKDFMLSHDYIKKDFDVYEWAAPEFAEQAAREMVEERWEEISRDKLSIPAVRLA